MANFDHVRADQHTAQLDHIVIVCLNSQPLAMRAAQINSQVNFVPPARCNNSGLSLYIDATYDLEQSSHAVQLSCSAVACKATSCPLLLHSPWAKLRDLLAVGRRSAAVHASLEPRTLFWHKRPHHKATQSQEDERVFLT